jgi:hypothetical protein
MEQTTHRLIQEEEEEEEDDVDDGDDEHLNSISYRHLSNHITCTLITDCNAISF